jgi:hypothetical protein
MLIAVPSKGRAGQVKTEKVLPSCVIYVPELEVDAYKKTGSVNVVGVPDKIKGITKTRNWILKNTNARHVVMVDDDVKSQGYVHLHSHKTKHKKLDEAVWVHEFKKLFDITEDLSFRIWGVATQSAARSVYPYKPFLWKSYVTASCMGIINDGKTYFDESFPVKEDYELNLRCIKEDGGVVAARYLYWENSHWGDDGGCKDYRTQLMEQECINLLAKKYPGMIRVTKRASSDWCIEIVT